MDKTDTTRSKILSAALDEFAAKGLAGVRVDEIARLAGVNKAMIYYHFASKEALYKALFQAELEQLKQEIAALMGQRDPASKAEMTAAVYELIEYVASKKKILSVLMSGVVLQGGDQAQFFQLLDVATAAGLDIVQEGKRKAKPKTDEILHELFTGLLPLIYFVLLREGLAAYYGWDAKKLNKQFVEAWLAQHVG